MSTIVTTSIFCRKNHCHLLICCNLVPDNLPRWIPSEAVPAHGKDRANDFRAEIRWELILNGFVAGENSGRINLVLISVTVVRHS